jgi:hypothetical protein
MNETTINDEINIEKICRKITFTKLSSEDRSYAPKVYKQHSVVINTKNTNGSCNAEKNGTLKRKE